LHLPARPILFGDRSLRARHGNVFVVVDPRRDTRAGGLNLVADATVRLGSFQAGFRPGSA
jgi:hypothetical protein